MTNIVAVLVERAAERLHGRVPVGRLVDEFDRADVAKLLVVVGKLPQELEELDSTAVLVVIVEARGVGELYMVRRRL